VFPFFPGLTTASLPHYMHPPMAMTCYRRTPTPAMLPKDFPDYLVYVTREALVATTTSLGKASAETHDALLRVNQLFVCDRMMRSVFPAGVPGMMPSWPGQMAGFVPQPTPAPRAAQPARPAAASDTARAQQTPTSDLADLASVASGATALNAVMSMAAAFLKFSPLMEPGRSAA
jgi:hypothetical protein